jgi:thiol-disulfide isomerase/thioredoxin
MSRHSFFGLRAVLRLGLVATLAVVGTLLIPVHSHAQSSIQQSQAVIYLFWGDGCPHCAEAKPFLENLADQHSQVILQQYEVWNDAQNQDLFARMADAHGIQAKYVPTIFIGDRYWQGYNAAVGQEIASAVETCLINGCVDAGEGVLTGNAVPSRPASLPIDSSSNVLDLPVIGRVDLATQSLAASTLLISFVDGFNPCSVWVLSMLLAITLHTGSRKKVLVIGLIFLTITAGVYALFIAGLFTVLTFVSFLGWIQVVVALVALFFSLVNIKDYFWYKQGVSFTIADNKKPGIFQRMRAVLDKGDSFWGLAGATAVMAAGVSLVEFSCTAGFPVLWTNLLAAQKVAPLVFILLLLLYLFIYQLDEMGIFLTAVFTLKSSRLEEKYGRILKLIGGMLMLTLAVVMIVNPALLSNLSSSMLIFMAAFGATLLVLLFHRKVLPAMGVRIGSEYAPARKSRRLARRRR